MLLHIYFVTPLSKIPHMDLQRIPRNPLSGWSNGIYLHFSFPSHIPNSGLEFVNQ